MKGLQLIACEMIAIRTVLICFWVQHDIPCWVRPVRHEVMCCLHSASHYRVIQLTVKWLLWRYWDEFCIYLNWTSDFKDTDWTYEIVIIMILWLIITGAVNKPWFQHCPFGTQEVPLDILPAHHHMTFWSLWFETCHLAGIFGSTCRPGSRYHVH